MNPPVREPTDAALASLRMEQRPNGDIAIHPSDPEGFVEDENADPEGFQEDGPQPKTEHPSTWRQAVGDFGHGGLQGLTAGFSDEAGAALQGALQRDANFLGDSKFGQYLADKLGVETRYGPTSPLDTYRQARTENRADEAMREERSPYAYMGGKLAGGLAIGLAAAPAGLPGELALGAAGGLGEGTSDLTKGEVLGATTEAATGTAAAGIAHGAGRLLSAGGKGIAKLAGRGAEVLAEKAAGMSGRELQASGGASGRALLDADAIHLLDNTKSISNRLPQMLEDQAGRMKEALTPLDSGPHSVSGDAVADRLESEANALRTKYSMSDRVQQQAGMMDRLANKLRQLGDMEFGQAHDERVGLDKEINWKPRGQYDTPPPPARQEAAKAARRALEDQIEADAYRADPRAAEAYRAAKEAYGQLATPAASSERAAANAGSHPVFNGLRGHAMGFGAAGMAAAMGHPATAAGIAGATLLKSRGAATAAIGADAMSRLSARIGQMGPYAGYLASAASRGPAALAAAHYVLQQRDPAYARAWQKASETSQPGEP